MTTAAPPLCDQCHSAMALLAEMPAVAVFRCEICDATRSIAKRVPSNGAPRGSRFASLANRLCERAFGVPFSDSTPASDPSARGPVRIGRLTIVYLAIVTIGWTVSIWISR